MSKIEYKCYITRIHTTGDKKLAVVVFNVYVWINFEATISYKVNNYQLWYLYVHFIQNLVIKYSYSHSWF